MPFLNTRRNMKKDIRFIDRTTWDLMMIPIKKYYKQNHTIDNIPNIIIKGKKESPRKWLNNILISLRLAGEKFKIPSYMKEDLEYLGYDIEEQIYWHNIANSIKSYYDEYKDIDFDDIKLKEWLNRQIDIYITDKPYKLSNNEKKKLKNFASPLIEERENTLLKQL
jgi:hypothetical protein